MRLFIAIEIPDDIKNEMADVQRRLKGSGVEASWTRAGGIHLTLKFLGEVPEVKIPEIIRTLSDTLRGTAGFQLEVARVGTFPNPRNARVVWIGVSGEVGQLTKLQVAVEGSIVGLGFEREDRPFTPHLTLGRIKSLGPRDTWLKSLDSVKDVRFPAFPVKAVSLMKSELKSTGAVYTEMGRVNLA